jgi:hypothetical protein
MPIWFVYRSPEEGLLGKHVKRLEGADTLLDWFRSIWRPIPDEQASWSYAEEVLGTSVLWSGYLFQRIAEDNLPPPTTLEELHQVLQAVVEEGFDGYRWTDDTLQALIGSLGEPISAVYWFTEDFARAHPERVAYLLHEDWRLPETVGPGGFSPVPGVWRSGPATTSEKALYCVELEWEESELTLFELLRCAEKLPGLRLPDLVPFALGLTDNGEEKPHPGPVDRLREQLWELLRAGEGLEGAFRRSLFEQPDAATWAAYTDWLVEQDRPRAELYLLELALRELATTARGSSKSEPLRVQVGPHCAVVLLPRQVIVGGPRSRQVYDQWFLFDDVWASGNVNLANALLDYAGRYNVLDDRDVAPVCGRWVPPGEERERRVP